MRCLLLAVMGMTLVALPGGCANPEKSTSGAPPITYTGPEVMRGTVRSLCRIRQYQPLLVSGYGIVVGLEGTGSSEVPAFLERHMANYARQMGVGDATMERQLPEQYRRFARMSPRELLQRRDTAIVAVEGLVPPGATPGTRFDVVVTALDQTQTTSLAGGTLWTTELSVGGINPSLPYSHMVAKAHGPIYLDPMNTTKGQAGEKDANDHSQDVEPTASQGRRLSFGASGSSDREHLRQATVINGGRTTERRRIELILNQPSWQRSRDIADRINERFPSESHERLPTANALNPQVIHLNIPERFSANPTRLIDLIAHLYIQRGRDFEPYQAHELAKALRAEGDDEQFTRAVVLAWRALGRTITPALREYYEDEDLNLRLAALQAGAYLQDERASRHLAPLAEHSDPQVRVRVAEALVALPDSNRGRETLRQLLDDDLNEVRLAAYKSAASTNNHELIDRFGIRGPDGHKFIIDRIDAQRPMIFVTHDHMPRIVIFGPERHIGLNMPLLVRLWNNRLMLHSEDTEVLKVYYQPPRQTQGQTYDLRPSVATLAYLLGQPANASHGRGLDLSFSEIIQVIHHLCQRGDIEAEFEFEGSEIAELVQRQRERVDVRPEISGTDQPDSAAQAETFEQTYQSPDAAPSASPPMPGDTGNARPETSQTSETR